jgi:C1A family cysteine protease
VKRAYNWRPDLPDVRDRLYQVTAAARPTHVDLRALCSPIEDQGNLGSCTAHAIAGALEFLEIKAGARFFDVSRLWIYYKERVVEGTVRQDSGAEIRDGVKVCAKDGYCTEAFWPYNIKKFTSRPSRGAYKDAAGRKITEYLRCPTLTECLNSIAEGYPVVFGFTVYDAFEGDKVAETGVLELPGPGEKPVGGHAVLMVGYDEPTNRVLVRNSWGKDWGQGGYFWMPYQYVGNRNLADDFWTLRK